MKRIFIDCEWNSYKGALISMALVPESGESFYEVLHCLKPHKWVLENVMPVLNKGPISRLGFANTLNIYLSQFDEIEVIADWPEDIEHFCKAIIIGPGERIGPDRMTFVVDRGCDSDNSSVPHNALADAIAIRDSYLTK